MKYVNLDIIKAHIPEPLYEHISDESIIDFHAFNALRSIVKDPSLFEYGVCIAQVENHVASLPDNFISIVEGFYSQINYFLDDKTPNNEVSTVLAKKIELGQGYYYDEGKRIYIGEAYMYALPDAMDSICPMRYVPFGNDFIANDCADIMCDYTCIVDYYVDKSGNFMRVSEEDGYVCVLYKRYPQDDKCNIYILDDIDLINAIAYTVIAKIYEERSYRKEEGAYQMSQDAYHKAMMHHRKYTISNRIKRFRPDNYRRIIVNRALGPAVVYNKMRFTA